MGPKTAAKWLNQYQTLDGLIAHAADIGGKVGENLRSGLELLELSRKLATIDTALSLEISAEGLTAGAPDSHGCESCTRGWNCASLLKALGSDAAAVPGGQRAAGTQSRDAGCPSP